MYSKSIRTAVPELVFKISSFFHATSLWPLSTNFIFFPHWSSLWLQPAVFSKSTCTLLYEVLLNWLPPQIYFFLGALGEAGHVTDKLPVSSVFTKAAKFASSRFLFVVRCIKKFSFFLFVMQHLLLKIRNIFLNFSLDVVNDQVFLSLYV